MLAKCSAMSFLDFAFPLIRALDPEQAGMAAGLLESAGIEAVVEDANLSGVNPFLRVAIEAAGFEGIETFEDLRASGPGRCTRDQIVLTARAP